MAIQYNRYDQEAISRLDDFLPDKIFDAHMHISCYPFSGASRFGIADYLQDMTPVFWGRTLRGMALATPTAELKTEEGNRRTLSFFSEELTAHPEFVGSIMVKPKEREEEILSHLQHPNIKGLKCYHTFAERAHTPDADIEEYLPETALAVANRRGMTITLHLVKDAALADPANLKKIQQIARNYPDLKLILAHSARAFASWTVMDSVCELIPYENIFFDFSAICESPSIMRILKKIGVGRCMWGSDYNVCTLLGKAISFGSGFYWILEEDIKRFSTANPLCPRHILLENLMAIREAAMLCDLSRKDVEDLFYYNADRLFQ